MVVIRLSHAFISVAAIRCHNDMGIFIPKTLVIWASPSHITLAIWVRVTGDAHVTRVLGMGMAKTGGCHCDKDTLETRRKLGRVNFRKDFWNCCLGSQGVF